ncbi:MAG: transposase [Patescibacteria group bacterium]|nr:transposase [Patescibacteria group bacterium]
MIARFCQAMQPKAWKPKPKRVRELQALVARLDALQALAQQEANRLDVAQPCVKGSIITVQATLNNEIKQVKKTIKQHIKDHDDLDSDSRLLLTIPGIADRTMAQVLGSIGSVEHFENAKQMAAFFGLSPKQHSSGSSVKRHTRLSKIEDARVRKALYMPAIVTMRHNPLIKTFCERLKAAGKAPMAIIGAVMRKLVHIIYGILKSRKPFDPNIIAKNT